MKRSFTLLCLLLQSAVGFAQANCSSPVPVTICPSTYLTGQTNTGMLDDAPSCNFPGNDLVYQINANINTRRIFVSFINLSNWCYARILGGSCNSTSCTTYYVSAGNQNITFSVSGSSTYYLWIDGSNNVTYDISIGGDTASTYVSAPSTSGTLSLASGCTTNNFSTSKPFLVVNYNGVLQRNPMTLAPLTVPGTMCSTIYLSNTTGVKGPRIFRFTLDPAGLINPSLTTTSFPGFYTPGTWNATVSGNVITYTFTDSAGTGIGDFNGPRSCAAYTFCYNFIPVSNDPTKTNINVLITTDNNGAGYSGYIRYGCCPSGMPTCLNGVGSAGGGTGTIGFGFNDPGGSGLPITLLDFKGEYKDDVTELTWSTATEVNNDHFTIERSKDGITWQTIGLVAGHGNSSQENEYSLTDEHPYAGITYYRISQTDFDGSTHTYDPITVNVRSPDWKVFPNPATDHILISGEYKTKSIAIFNMLGEIALTEIHPNENAMDMSIETLTKGMYYMRLISEYGETKTIKILIKGE